MASDEEHIKVTVEAEADKNASDVVNDAVEVPEAPEEIWEPAEETVPTAMPSSEFDEDGELDAAIDAEALTDGRVADSASVEIADTVLRSRSHDAARIEEIDEGLERMLIGVARVQAQIRSDAKMYRAAEKIAQAEDDEVVERLAGTMERKGG